MPLVFIKLVNLAVRTVNGLSNVRKRSNPKLSDKPETLAAMGERHGSLLGTSKNDGKIEVELFLAPEVLSAFKATGSDWQTRIDLALKDWLKSHTPS